MRLIENDCMCEGRLSAAQEHILIDSRVGCPRLTGQVLFPYLPVLLRQFRLAFSCRDRRLAAVSQVAPEVQR